MIDRDDLSDLHSAAVAAQDSLAEPVLDTRREYKLRGKRQPIAEVDAMAQAQERSRAKMMEILLRGALERARAHPHERPHRHD